MNNKKELIAQNKLRDIIFDYITPELNDYEKNGGFWKCCSQTGNISWYFGNRSCCIGVRLCNDHWEIYNDCYYDTKVNIKIYSNRVEFLKESEFTDFNYESMYGLYRKIKDIVEGGNEDNIPVEKNEDNKEIKIEKPPTIPPCDYKDFKKKIDDVMELFDMLCNYAPNSPYAHGISKTAYDDIHKIANEFCLLYEANNKDHDNKNELIRKETLKSIIRNNISSDIEYHSGTYYEIDQHNSFGWILVDVNGDIESKVGCELIDGHWEIYHRTKRTKRVFVKIYPDRAEYIKQKNYKNQSIKTNMEFICEDVRNYINMPSEWKE